MGFLFLAGVSATLLISLREGYSSEITGIANKHFQLKVNSVLPQIMVDHIRAAYSVNIVRVDAEFEEHRLNVLLHDLQVSSQGEGS